MRDHPRRLIAASTLILAFNLRIAPVTLGPVLPQLSADLDISESMAGLLTSLPGVCLIIFGLGGGHLAQVIGLRQGIWLALAMSMGGWLPTIYQEAGFSPTVAGFSSV